MVKAVVWWIEDIRLGASKQRELTGDRPVIYADNTLPYKICSYNVESLTRTSFPMEENVKKIERRWTS